MRDGFTQTVFIDSRVEYMGANLMTDSREQGQNLIRQPAREDGDSADRMAIESREAGEKQKKLRPCQGPRREVPVERPQDRDRRMGGAILVNRVGLPEQLLVESVLVGRGLCRVHMAFLVR